MPAPRDRQSLIKAATMYFIDGRSQADIASTFGTSPSNVSRMIAAARSQNLVQIRVADYAVRDADLEGQIRSRFGVREALVAAFSPGSDPLNQVGSLAAEWLDTVLRHGQTLGVSWGRTVQAMSAALLTDRPRDVEVVPMVGGLSATASLTSGQELVRQFSEKLGGTYRYLHAPAVLRSKLACQALLDEPSIATALEHARHVDVAVVGIGSAGIGSSADVLEQLHLSRPAKAAFEAAGAIGDLCCRFFDAAGTPIGGAVHDQVIAIELADLQAIGTRMGLASGPAKAGAVLGAIRGGHVDHIAVDTRLAEALLALPD